MYTATAAAEDLYEQYRPHLILFGLDIHQDFPTGMMHFDRGPLLSMHIKRPTNMNMKEIWFDQIYLH